MIYLLLGLLGIVVVRQRLKINQHDKKIQVLEYRCDNIVKELLANRRASTASYKLLKIKQTELFESVKLAHSNNEELRSILKQNGIQLPEE